MGLGISLKPESKIFQRQSWSKYCQGECVCGRQWPWEGERPGSAVASVGSRCPGDWALLTLWTYLLAAYQAVLAAVQEAHSSHYPVSEGL